MNIFKRLIAIIAIIEPHFFTKNFSQNLQLKTLAALFYFFVLLFVGFVVISGTKEREREKEKEKESNLKT